VAETASAIQQRQRSALFAIVWPESIIKPPSENGVRNLTVQVRQPGDDTPAGLVHSKMADEGKIG